MQRLSSQKAPIAQRNRGFLYAIKSTVQSVALDIFGMCKAFWSESLSDQKALHSFMLY